LARLNIGVFILHAIFTANFVVLPLLVKNSYIYVYALFIVLLFMPPLLRLAQKKPWLEPLSLAAIFLLVIAELLLQFFGIINLVFGLIMFFTAFTFLEASLPSLVARIAPPHSRGAAMGIYSCVQFLGIFAGGIAGGWIYGQYGIQNVFLFCAMLAAIWYVFFYLMRA
jgi:predicted MFS family arabinose efflux permease